MSQPSDVRARPPQWAIALLERTLPRDPLRDAILGDLHEEFVDDVLRVGDALARMRCTRRALGIAAYASFDRLLCRSWVSEDSPSPRLGDASATASAKAPVAAAARAAALQGVARYAIIALLGFVVLLVGIVGNTMLFSAIEPTSARATSVRATSVAGVGGVVLFVACAAAAAIIVCAGPRWRRRRLRGT